MIGPFQGEYRWLSNFWPVRITVDGVGYSSVEQAYQVWKLEHPTDRLTALSIKKPGELKRWVARMPQRLVTDRQRRTYMLRLLRLKFEKPSFRKKLLSTGTAPLVELNNWNDQFWGVCRGVGRNYLGRLLMKVRRELV